MLSTKNVGVDKKNVHTLIDNDHLSNKKLLILMSQSTLEQYSLLCIHHLREE